MITLRVYREEIGLLSRKEVINARRDVFKAINGEAFFAIRRWPQDIELIFWKKAISDQGTFKLVLFLLGNGCAPELISRWVMLSQFWASSPSVAEKRARQVDNEQCRYEKELLVLLRCRLRKTADVERETKGDKTHALSITLHNTKRLF